MAAMTIKAREMAEKVLKSFIFDELVKSPHSRHSRARPPQ
jgi:hypothetical protein